MCMDKNDFDALLQKYLHGTATPEEEALVEQWYAAIDNPNAASVEAEQGLTKRRIWQGVKRHVRDRGMAKVHTGRSFRLTWALGMAAVLSAAVIAYVFVFAPDAENPDQFLGEGTHYAIINSSPADSTVQLMDGSRISLQPGTMLHVAGSFNQTRRAVYLEQGEAFFEVAKDATKPFYVYTQNVVTRVLGTSFTVNARKPDVIVAVKTGKVSVFARAAQDPAPDAPAPVILTPNQQAVYDAQRGVLSRQLIDAPAPLLSELEIEHLHFDGAGAATIFDALSKAYGISIAYDRQMLASCRLTTSIDKNESLYERLDILCDAIGASYAIDGVTIKILSTGCN